MSDANDTDLVQPLRASEAKKVIRDIVANGEVAFTRHAIEELAKDGATTVDAINVLRGGIVREAEYENGEWRHRVETPRMVVVVTIETRTRLVVITGWRIKR